MYNGKIRGKDNQSSNQLGTVGYFHDVSQIKNFQEVHQCSRRFWTTYNVLTLRVRYT
jgi:hypothetical protein